MMISDYYVSRAIAVLVTFFFEKCHVQRSWQLFLKAIRYLYQTIQIVDRRIISDSEAIDENKTQ